ncbi:hypothetical protein GCM10023093_14210 [Nemorincola caseinilytica]|uniref:Capsule assembly Wzi family protein n=1 Tax=Nemorincola caseinilytica TaxID=2054315 RepID=A0ABP8NAV0_9BACT
MSGIAAAQTTFLRLGSDGYHNIDRWETLNGRLCDSLANGDKPESRRNVVRFIERISHPGDTALGLYRHMSDVDRYNMQQMVSESGEWAGDENGAIDSKHPILNTFYKKQFNMIYVKTNNFFVVVNPVAGAQAVMQNNDISADPVTGTAIPNTTRSNFQGAEVRGWIGKKIGFYTMLTDNQERFPYFVNNWARRPYEAVPGADYFKRPLTQFGTYDYLQVNGYVNADIVKNHVNATFGFGKHFIGDGFTSLFLTDNSSNVPFLRIQTRIWKLNYECLYMELTPQYIKGADRILPHKYSTIRYLNANVFRWLNLGLFESQVFARTGGYEIAYLNPMILTTAMSRYNGAGDKSMLGLSAKALVARHFQFYGQFLLNEFRIKELTGGNKWYGNKWGVQMGGKYFNAFGIKNLDLQGEVDAVRPYTYSAQDTIANYTNYNQPMADPLGSGFIKAIGQARYEPVKNLVLTARITYYMRGNDTGNANYGNNTFKPYPTATTQYGVKMINGPESRCKMVSLNASYQLRPNLFADLGGVYRNYENVAGIYPHSSTTGTWTGPLTTTYFYFGVRINASRRAYDLF